MQLTPLEARILGSLIEKEVTTPEYYPLTLNALLMACNQKNNRAPVLALDEEGIEQLFTVHDEDVTEVPYGQGTLQQVEEIMGRSIGWAPDLPLRGDGFETEYYMKELD
ncbi:MAG: DUF480 domain-containing protein [Rhodoferax sp.]|nr:DUF480 domain-containing protein [Rhodoferax sp.]